MDNKIKSKTRLAAVQLISQHLINNQDIEIIKDDFDKYYLNTQIDNSLEKIKYNVNFLSLLITYFKNINKETLYHDINHKLDFQRKFEKWDTINKAIILMAIAELQNTNKDKFKILLNDYIDISKSFVSLKETKLINAILDKLVNEKK